MANRFISVSLPIAADQHLCCFTDICLHDLPSLLRPGLFSGD